VTNYCISIVANLISLKKYGAIKIIFIWLNLKTRKTFSLEIILWKCLLKDYKNPEDILSGTGILKQLTKALIERCLNAELDTHLQEEKAERSEAPPETAKPKNQRNGHSQKTIKGDKGEFRQTAISVLRDRNGKAVSTVSTTKPRLSTLGA
jgi:putative transposase